MTTPLKTRILLADDHEVVRNGLQLVLDSVPDLEVVAQASDGAEAVERALAEDVDLAVLDVSMPRMTGLQAAREIRAHAPDTRVLMLSMHDDERYFFEALKAGASGYVLKSAANRDLIEACRAAMRGEPFLYPQAVTALIRDYLERARSGEETPEDPLSPRELEVVKLIAEGMTSEEIGERVGASGVRRHSHPPGSPRRGPAGHQSPPPFMADSLSTHKKGGSGRGQVRTYCIIPARSDNLRRVAAIAIAIPAEAPERQGYSAALSRGAGPARNWSSSAVSSAFAALRWRILTWPKPRIFSGMAARPTAMWWLSPLSFASTSSSSAS